MDKDFWIHACHSSVNRILQQKLQANRIAGIVAVSAAPVSCAGDALPRNDVAHLCHFQVMLFVLGAVTSGICWCLQHRLLLWRRRGWEVVGDRTWKDLGQYSGWMCAGCFCGIVAFSTRMLGYNWLHESDDPSVSRRVSYELKALHERYLAAFSVFFSFQVQCITHAMNLLLRRVSDHASHSYYNVARDHDQVSNQFDWRDCIGQYRLFNLVRSFHSFSMLLCTINVVARVAVAAFRAESAKFFDEAAVACDTEGNDSSRSLDISKYQVSSSSDKVQESASIARLFESSNLVLMAVAFLLYFPACIIMFHRIERRLDVINQEMSLRSDIGNVLLPYEFSPPAEDGSRTQIEIPVVQARHFIGRLKSAATRKRIRFLYCMIIMLIALAMQASYAVFHAIVSFAFYVKRNFE
jgi:hypothetical protein